MNSRRIFNVFIIVFTTLILGCTSVVVNDNDGEIGYCWVADPDAGQITILGKSNDEIIAINNTDVGKPISVLYDPYREFTWVGDANGRVLLMTPRAQLNRTIYGFSNPVALGSFPKEGSVWVLDTGLGKVFKLGDAGAIELILGGYADAVDLDVDPISGEVFVAHTTRITRLSNKGVVLGEFTGYTDITDIEYEGSINRLWVVDRGAGTFSRLKNDGTIVQTISVEYDEPYFVSLDPVRGLIYIAGIVNDEWIVTQYHLESIKGVIVLHFDWSLDDIGVQLENEEGTEPELDYIGPVTIKASLIDGTLWVNDYTNHRVFKIGNAMTPPAIYGLKGGFFAPTAMAVTYGPR